MKMLKLLLLLICLFPSLLSSDVWKPNPKFSVESSDYIETLTFISGIAYALTYSDKKLKAEAKDNFYCLPDGQIPDSKLLIDLLNEKLSGDQTSEIVIALVIDQLSKEYPCE